MTSLTSHSDTAYWTRPEHRQTAPAPCFRDGCTNRAATTQDERFRGRYCTVCLARLRADAALIGKELVG